jgi:hypothetical protein
MRLIDADALIAQMEADAEHMDDQIAIMFTYAAISDVKHAPTIEPEPHWIPCSEKPIASGMYIVTLKDEKGLFTDTAEWNPTFGGRWQSVFYDDYAIGEYRDISNVVAWMPLPEPYKEGQK